MAFTSAFEGMVGRYVGRAIEPILHRRSERQMAGWKDETVPGERPAAWWSDDSCWYAGGTPPRQHNHVMPLIDGDEYFAELRAAIEQAQHYIYIIGWFLTPYLPLGRRDLDDVANSRLLKLLSDAAQRVPVRILLWNGTPVLLQPTSRVVRSVQKVIERRQWRSGLPSGRVRAGHTLPSPEGGRRRRPDRIRRWHGPDDVSGRSL